MTVSSMANRQAPPTIPLKERQREARTGLILEVTYDELVAKGYHGVSMDEIAAQVGISKGTLYLHFAGKEALVARLLEREIAQYLVLIEEVVRQEMTVRARLERILLETYHGIQGGHQFLLAMRAIGWNKGAIWERLEKQVSLSGLTDSLARLFEEGQRRGELDATLPTPILVALFMGLMRLYGDEQLDNANPLAPEEVVRAAGHILFQGILAPAAGA